MPSRRPNSARRLRPGISPSEHRSGPCSSHRAGSPNRIGSASPPPQPVLRCKRRSQLSQDRAPVRPHVLHSLPCRYGEGDMHVIAGRTHPSAGDALGTAEQTPGQHQGRSLVNAEPITLHKLHPANDGTEGRVHLMYLHTLPVATGDEVRPWPCRRQRRTASGCTCGSRLPAPLSSAGSPDARSRWACQPPWRIPPRRPPRRRCWPQPDDWTCRR